MCQDPSAVSLLEVALNSRIWLPLKFKCLTDSHKTEAVFSNVEQIASLALFMLSCLEIQVRETSRDFFLCYYR